MSRFLQDVLPLSLASRGHLPCPMRYCGAILNAIEYWFTSGAERLKNTRPSIGERNVSCALPSKVSCTSASA